MRKKRRQYPGPLDWEEPRPRVRAGSRKRLIGLGCAVMVMCFLLVSAFVFLIRSSVRSGKRASSYSRWGRGQAIEDEETTNVLGKEWKAKVLNQLATDVPLGKYRRVVVLNRTSPWMLKGEDPETDFFFDYLLPLSSCTMKNIGLEDAEDVGSAVSDNMPLSRTRSPWTDKRRVVKVTSETMWPPMQRHWRHHVPYEYRERGKDLLWWRAQLVTYIMRPSRLTVGLVRKQEAKVFGELLTEKGVEGGLLGVHMRHGLSTVVKGNRKHFPFSKYLEAASDLLNVLRQENVSPLPTAVPQTVLLSTEHTDELEETKREYTGEGKPLRVVNVEEMDTDAHSLRLKQAAFNHPRLHLICVSNLFLQLRSTFFVGTFTSNFGRIIVELQLGLGATVRAASLDMEWEVNP